MIVTLPTAIAERLGASEADVYEDGDGIAHVMVNGENRRPLLAPPEQAKLLAMALPHERAPEPGRPMKRGEGGPRRHRGEHVSARRTGFYTSLMRSR